MISKPPPGNHGSFGHRRVVVSPRARSLRGEGGSVLRLWSPPAAEAATTEGANPFPLIDPSAARVLDLSAAEEEEAEVVVDDEGDGEGDEARTVWRGSASDGTFSSAASPRCSATTIRSSRYNLPSPISSTPVSAGAVLEPRQLVPIAIECDRAMLRMERSDDDRRRGGDGDDDPADNGVSGSPSPRAPSPLLSQFDPIREGGLLWALGRPRSAACGETATPENVAALLVATIELERAVREAVGAARAGEGRGDGTAGTRAAADAAHRGAAADNAPLLSVLLQEFQRLESDAERCWGATGHENTAEEIGDLSTVEAETATSRDFYQYHPALSAPDPRLTPDSGRSVAPEAPPPDAVNLSPILNCLLLPSGLNLRNLLWHGFVGTVKRPWLSLVVIVLSHLKRRVQPEPTWQRELACARQTFEDDSCPEPDYGSGNGIYHATTDGSVTRARSPVKTVIANLPKNWKDALRARKGEGSHANDHSDFWSVDPAVVEAVSQWMPTPQHVELWHLAVDWISLPVRRALCSSRPLHVDSLSATATVEVIEAESPPEATNPTHHSTAKLSTFPRNDDQVEFEGIIDGKPSEPCCSFCPSSLVCAILAVLLEAGLRRQFCEANGRLGSDACARPGAYYVTLDGHGQRLQHELLLQPYLSKLPVQATDGCPDPGATTEKSEAKVKNLLLEQLGASLVSFLSDIFVSPYGPNLRAVLSHGRWIARMRFDLAMLVTPMRKTVDEKDLLSSWSASSRVRSDSTRTPTFPSDDEVSESMDILLAALHACAISKEKLEADDSSFSCYQPQFSFTATCLAALKGIETNLESLGRLMASTSYLTTKESHACDAASDSVKELACFLHGETNLQGTRSEVLDRLRGLLFYLRPEVAQGASTQWTLELLFREFDSNREVGPLVATRSLLTDLNAALSRLLALLRMSLLEVDSFANIGSSRVTSRQRKSRVRYIKSADAIVDFYSFACHVAVESLQAKLRLASQEPETLREQLSGGRCSCLSSQELLKVVQRTRMVVSTVDTFFAVNSDRAFKAIDGYTRSKLVKKYISSF